MPRRSFERKGDAIEAYLREHPGLGPTDLAALISRETAYKTTPHQVSLVKTRLRQEGQLPTAARTTAPREDRGKDEGERGLPPAEPAAAGPQAEAADGAGLAEPTQEDGRE